MNLEKILKNNIEAFNSDEPSHNHFEKFRKKLQKLKNKKDNKMYPVFYKIAIVFFIIVISTGILYLVKFIKSNNTITTISQISDELHEVEMYYKSQINNNYKKIRDLNFNNIETEKRLVVSELKEMDAAYKDLLEDLTQNPYDDRVINAIINYYQLKIEFMDKIIHIKKTNI